MSKDYEEALERAKYELKKDNPDGVSRAIERIFPELAESEDERIRKNLIRMVGNVRNDSTEKGYYDIPFDKYIAYLEKQKEQNTQKVRDIVSGDAIESCMLRYLQSAANRKDDIEIIEDTKEYKKKLIELVQKEQKDYHKLYNDIAQSEWFKKAYKGKSLGCGDEQKPVEYEEDSNDEIDITESIRTGRIGALENLLSYLKYERKSTQEEIKLSFIPCIENLLEEIEQKPTEWSQEDEEHLDSIIESYKELLKDYSANNGVDYIPYNTPTVARTVLNDIGFLNSLPERFDLQPKQEWGEEDKRLLRTTLECLNYISCQSKVPVVNWLKLLPERFNLQPNQEWSEEDEKDIILAIKQVWQEKDANRMIAKLKSLRPQPKREQMALHWESGHPESYKSVLILRKGNVVVEGEWDEKTGRWYQYGFQSYIKDNEIEGWMSKKSLLSDTSDFRSSWKPSEEQMGALNYAYCELFKREDVGHNILGPLQNLIDTLRKL